MSEWKHNVERLPEKKYFVNPIFEFINIYNFCRHRKMSEFLYLSSPGIPSLLCWLKKGLKRRFTCIIKTIKLFLRLQCCDLEVNQLLCAGSQFIVSEGSPPELFLGTNALKIYRKFTGEHPCQSAISVLCNFIEITLRHGYSVNLLHIFRTPFPKNTSEGLWLPLLSSVWRKYWP